MDVGAYDPEWTMITPTLQLSSAAELAQPRWLILSFPSTWSTLRTLRMPRLAEASP